MSIETLQAPSLKPIASDGDAALPLRRVESLSQKMDIIAQKGMTPDGSFAMTTGAQVGDGFDVLADSTGEHLRSYFETHGGQGAVFDAWAERARLASGQQELPIELQAGSIHESLNKYHPKRIALNARGELGQTNLLARTIADQDEALLVEKNGQVFKAHKQPSRDDYQVFVLGDQGSFRVGNADVALKYGDHQGIKVLEVQAMDETPVQLDVAPVSEMIEAAKVKNGLLKGILRGARQRQAREGNMFEGIDLTAVDTAINDHLQSRINVENEALARDENTRIVQELEQANREAVSIEKLTAKYPEAGNLFTPGASIFEDKGWQELMASAGVRIPNELTDQHLKELLHKPEIRQKVAEMLGARLDAWCLASPARDIQMQFSANTKLDDTSGVINPEFVKTHYPEDSLIHYTSSEEPTIANTLVPSRVSGNAAKVLDVDRKFGHATNQRSRNYVVTLALAMMDGSFDENLNKKDYRVDRYTDPESRVLVHDRLGGHHRLAASLITFGKW